jgi:hypothetical protein
MYIYIFIFKYHNLEFCFFKLKSKEITEKKNLWSVLNDLLIQVNVVFALKKIKTKIKFRFV